MTQDPAAESSRGEQPMPADLAAAVALGGEMGRLFAEFDWAAHPLGPPQDWPAEMRSTVALALTSRFPMTLFLDASNLFLIYNDASIPILGDKHPSGLGRTGQQVWWDVWEQAGPMLRSVVATGVATWADDLSVTLVIRGRPQERYFTFSFSPLIASGGQVYGVCCAVAETTERVLSERRLHLLNSIGSSVIGTQTVDDVVGAAVAVCADQQADLPFVAAYVGGSAGLTLRGATPSVLPLLPPTLAQLTDWDPTARSRGEMLIIDRIGSIICGLEEVLGAACPEQTLVLPLGEGSTAGALVVGANPLCPLDGQYREFCQLLADQLSSSMASAVSYEQQRQRADGLAELDRAKTAFLANVSHEFRTPLTLLLGPLDDALSDAGPDALLSYRLRTARRNAGRLLRLVDSLLDFSRIEAGRATAKLVCTDVGALTSHIASSFTELCQRAGLDLILDCRPALADVDTTMWETIMLNLLANAVKYTLQGTIWVEVHGESEQQSCIAVRDTGVGIAEADLKRIGERFFRAGTARGRSVEGTGIGLSLVQGLVELHGGTVHIDSELDRGTTVTIRLPKSVGDTPVDLQPAGLVNNPYVVEASQWLARLPATPTDGAAPSDERRELVLIADDNADMRTHLERLLSAHWRTVSVADGESALTATRELRPDAVVTDFMMPGIDGFEYVAAVRADPDLAATPILMLSARAGDEAVSEGFAGGADDYLPKPFRSRELVDRVAARLSAAARERASRQLSDAARLESDFAQLEAALQASDSVLGIADVLMDSPLGSGDAIAVVIGVLDADENNVRFEYAGPVPAELRDRYHVASLDTPLVPIDVIKSGERMVITDTLSIDQRYQHIVEVTGDKVRACVSQPLRGLDGRVIGSLGLLWPTPRVFDAAELDVFARVAQTTQAALDRIRIMHRERRIAVDFQEHLLDLDRGSTAAVVSAVYQPAGEEMRVGGDWYLVVTLDGPERIAISVGDVVGHGLPAAIVMSRLRAAVAATALTGADPAMVLTVLDRYAAAVPGARCATVSYAVIDNRDDIGTHDGTDTGTATMSYTCAGHPYPLVVPPDQRPLYLKAGRRPPVAAWENRPAHNTAKAELPPGSLVLLYTDGLIERPGETLDEGFVRLQDAAARCRDLPIADVCAELLERMTPPDGYTDDVALLALRPCHSTVRSFAVVMPAALTSLAPLRNRLRSWLSTIAVDPQRTPDIVLGTGEAVTNAIEHGSLCDPRKTVAVEAFLRGDTVAVTVSDSGQWSGDSSASQRSRRRGRGLTLINGLADRVDTQRSPQGTRITLQFHHAVVSALVPVDVPSS